MNVHPKGKKLVVQSFISDKNLAHKRKKLVEQARRIARPRKRYGEQGEINLYNSMVTGMQNYYQIATHINLDCSILNRAVMTVLTNRLSTRTGNRLSKTGRKLTEFERKRFSKSKMLRFVAGTEEPIYPIGFTQHKNPLFRKKEWNIYTEVGRKGLHDNLRINISVMLALMRQPLYGRSVEYSDNRISRFSAQWGRCAVTGNEFMSASEIHCHHVIPRKMGGNDAYDNLVLVSEPIHRLIHATQQETIQKYKNILCLDKKQLKSLNKFREKVGLSKIT